MFKLFVMLLICFFIVFCKNNEDIIVIDAKEISIIAQIKKPVVCSENNEFNDGSKNISIKKHINIKGIDVSKWQGKILWDDVYKSNYDFVFIRLSNGVKQDSLFLENWKNAKKNKMIVGAYQFIRPSQSPEQQAELVVKLLNEVSFSYKDLPVAFDLEVSEDKDNKFINEFSKKWMKIIEDKLNITPIIYGSPKGTISILDKSFSKYPLWIANYDTDLPKIPKNWNTWHFWQKSETGYVSGIKGNVDINEFNGQINILNDFILKYNKHSNTNYLHEVKNDNDKR